MKILILTPNVLPRVTGNAITAERWRRFLAAKGHSVQVIASDGGSASELLLAIDRFAPEVMHVHHVLRSGALLIDPEVEAASRDIPVAVS
ncbi:MAG TPA: hypothetical protein VLS90_17970, partial [Thermodesulfobacteriota bacterium]|nr:hypothetical protein [Thermodesulfobacteriota bacterium]